MAGEKYVDKAVEALYDRLTDATLGVNAQLRVVETAKGYAANLILDVVDFVRDDTPLDNRTPLIQVFDEGSSPAAAAGQRHSLLAVDVVVVIATVAPDADHVTAARRLREYVTAIMQSVDADPYLAGEATGCIFQGSARADTLGDQSVRRKVHVLRFQVRVQSS